MWCEGGKSWADAARAQLAGTLGHLPWKKHPKYPCFCVILRILCSVNDSCSRVLSKVYLFCKVVEEKL